MDLPKNSDAHPHPALKEAQDAGFDLNLLELNLSLTHEQRIRQHQSALSLILELTAAGLKADR